MLIRITSKYFCAGYDMNNGNIAPIIKYMKDWSFERIKNYCSLKGWKLEWLDD